MERFKNKNFKTMGLPGQPDSASATIAHVNAIIDNINVGGSFYSTATQTVAAINTAYTATLNNTVYSNGVTIDAATSKVITVTLPGTYSFDFTLQVNKSEIILNPGNLTAWLVVNGTAQAYTANKLGFAITNADLVMTLHTHLVLNAGDTVSLNYAADNTTMSLKYTAASSPYPAISSVSLEVDKIK
jgi:hypothetical protein